jgi:hypothetical protein
MDLSRKIAAVIGGTNAADTRPHLHQPERGEHESFAAYKARRAASQKAVARVLAGALIDPRTLGKGRSSTDRERARVRAERPEPPQPKFPRERKRKQHAHQLHDEHGAYTLVGGTYEVEGIEPDTSREHVTSSWVDGEDFGYTARRKWLGGISAQRGY